MFLLIAFAYIIGYAVYSEFLRQRHPPISGNENFVRSVLWIFQPFNSWIASRIAQRHALEEAKRKETEQYIRIQFQNEKKLRIALERDRQEEENRLEEAFLELQHQEESKQLPFRQAAAAIDKMIFK